MITISPIGYLIMAIMIFALVYEYYHEFRE